MPVLDDPIHERFCQEYLKDFNAARAGRDMGLADGSVYGILDRALVQARLRELATEALNKNKGTVESVLRELDRIASSDLLDAFDETNCLKPLADIPEDVRRCIAGIEVDEIWEGYGKERRQIGVTKKIKLWDKNKGLEMLGKYHKLFVDKPNAADIGDTLVTLLARSWELGKADGQREQTAKLVGDGQKQLAPPSAEV